MTSKIWLSLCLVLFAYNLTSLISECYSVNYKIVEEDDALYEEDSGVRFLFCTPFSNIQLNNHLDVPEQRNVSIRSFLNYSISSIEHRLNLTNLFNLNESYIFNYHVCFLVNKTELEDEGTPLNSFLETYATFYIFIFSKERLPYFYENVYRKNDRNASVYFNAYMQKIFNRNFLQNPDCSNRENQIYYNRGKCLSNCFASLKVKSEFYDSNDTNELFNLDEIFDLDKIFKNRLPLNPFNSLNPVVNDIFHNLFKKRHPSLEITKKDFEYCHTKCKSTDCFWEVVTVVKVPDYLREEGKEKVALLQSTHLAYYSTDDYYLQLFGLLTLFTGTSIVKLLPALLLLAIRKLKRHHFTYYRIFRIFRLIYPKIKFAITLISFIFVLNQCLLMISEFKFKSNYPNRTSAFRFVSEPFSVVVCFPIEAAFFEDKEIRKGRNSDILKNHNFRSIEESTRQFFSNRTLVVQAITGSGEIKTNHNVSKEIIFKDSTFQNLTFLSRCFRVDFEMEALRYKKTIPPVLLNFSLDVSYKEHFLIERSQSFTSGLVNFRGMFNQQRIVKKLLEESKKSSCRDFSKEPSCSSRRNCIDRCRSIEFVKEHGSIPTNTVLNASHLPSFVLNGEFKFNEISNRSIEEKCSNLFKEPGCNDTYFEESHELVFSQVRGYLLLRLDFLNKIEKEMQYEIAKTFLDILSQWSIFFGINARGALATLFFTICKAFKLKFHKVYKVIIFLMAGVGFLTHVYLVFKGIVRSELNENEFFERAERYIMPMPIFCFVFSKETNENQLLTGEYLDDLTKNFTFQQVFEEIIYFNQKDFTSLLIHNLTSTKSSDFYSDPDLRLTHFYYADRKCFKINLEVDYYKKDFYFLENKDILKIYLKPEFKWKKSQMYFFYQQPESNETSGGQVYDIGYDIGRKDGNFSYRYEITFEQFKIVREDKFELLKDPRNLFFEKSKMNDVTDYFNMMRKHFHDDYNLTTSQFLLDEYFNVPIDNELFEQYFMQIQDPSDQTKFKSQNFEQHIPKIITSVFLENCSYRVPDFTFSLSHLTRLTMITNNENYTKIVVTVLNSLSLWVNVCILDLGTYINKIFRLGLHVYYLLIWVRCRIRRAIGNLGRV